MGRIIDRRRVMGGKKLPYDAEVEYLESTGTQWINTGIVGEGDLKVDTTIGTKKNKMWAFGSRISYQTNAFYLAHGGTSGYSWGRAFINYNRYYATSGISNEDDSIFQISFSNDFYLNGKLLNHWDLSDFNNNLNIYIFACNQGNKPLNKSSMRLYNFKIYKRDIVIEDLIPVRVGNVGYLYDKVSGELFGNQGTGDFILGPDLLGGVIV